MLQEIATSFRDAKDNALRRRILAVYLFLTGLNLAAWRWHWPRFIPTRRR